MQKSRTRTLSVDYALIFIFLFSCSRKRYVFPTVQLKWVIGVVLTGR